MANELKNYRVTANDGEERVYQFREDDPGLKALRDAAKNPNSDVKTVAAGEPKPVNGKASA